MHGKPTVPEGTPNTADSPGPSAAPGKGKGASALADLVELRGQLDDFRRALTENRDCHRKVAGKLTAEHKYEQAGYADSTRYGLDHALFLLDLYLGRYLDDTDDDSSGGGGPDGSPDRS